MGRDFQKIIQNSSIFFVSSGLVSLLAYGFHLAAARLLSVSDYGSLQTLIAIQNIGLIPVTVMIAVLTKIMAEHKQSGLNEESLDLRIRMRRWFIFPGILMLVPLLLLTPFMMDFLNIRSGSAFFLLWFSIYLTFFQVIDNSFLNGWHRFSELNAATVLNGTAKFLGGLFFMMLGWKVVGGLLGITLGFLVNIGLSSYFIGENNFFAARVRSIEKKFSWSKLRSVLQKSKSSIAGILAITLLANVDLLIAKHHFDPYVAGHYGALFILSKIIFFAVSSLAVMVIPIVTAEKNHGKKKMLFLFISFINLLLAVIGVAIFYYFPNLVIQLLFGEDYLDIAQFLARFGLLALLLSLLNMFVQYFISLDQSKILNGVAILAVFEMIFLWFGGADFQSFFVIMIIFLIISNVLSGVHLLFSQKMAQGSIEK